MDDIYKTDLTDGQWCLIEPILPEAKPGGRPRSTNLREVINAIFYQLRTGCPALFRLNPLFMTIFHRGSMMEPLTKWDEC